MNNAINTYQTALLIHTAHEEDPNTNHVTIGPAGIGLMFGSFGLFFLLFFGGAALWINRSYILTKVKSLLRKKLLH